MAIRISAELPSCRIRRFVVQIEPLQSKGIGETSMPAAMYDDDRIIGRCLVQILPCEFAVFESFGVIVLKPADPFPFRRMRGALSNGPLNVGKRPEIAVYRSHVIDSEEPDVCMRINKTRQDGLSCKIGLLCVRSG